MLKSRSTCGMCMQALQKRHSTTEEALQVAADCGAFRTVLTHFSQRYPRLPPSLAGDSLAGDDLAGNSPAGDDVAGYNLSGSNLAGRAVAAFDGMRIPLTALRDVPKIGPVLQYALDKGESLEEKRQAGILFDSFPNQSMQGAAGQIIEDIEGVMLPRMSQIRAQTGNEMPLIGLEGEDLIGLFQKETVLDPDERKAAEHAHATMDVPLEKMSKSAQEVKPGGRILCQHIRFED